MRDIRPVPGNPKPKEPTPPLRGLPKLPPNVPKGPSLPPKKTSEEGSPPPSAPSAPLPVKRLPGTSVPVTPIHVAPSEKIFRSSSSLPKKITPPLAPSSKPTPVARSAPVAPTPVRIGHRERKFVFALIALAITAALLAGFIFIPKADIKLGLRTAPLLVDEQLVIAATAGDSSTIAGSAYFREVQAEGSTPTTSTEIVGAKATGSVQIINRALEEQKIKEQSRLVTKDGTLFYMQRSATVPPASSGSPSAVTIPIEAAEAGEEGNIEPQRLNFAALDPSSQTLVYAEVTQALTGGSGEVQPIVHEADLEGARKAAGEAARAQVEQEIRKELPNGWATLEESWTSEVTSFESPIAVDSKESTIPYTARVVVRVMGYQQSALEDKLKTALEERMDQEYMLFPGPISYTKSVEDVNWDEGRATISARVTHTTIPRLSLETLRQKLAGRSQAEAKNYLENLPGVRAVEIKLWPFWVTTIPRIEKRILLDFQSERQP